MTRSGTAPFGGSRFVTLIHEHLSTSESCIWCPSAINGKLRPSARACFGLFPICCFPRNVTYNAGRRFTWRWIFCD